MPFSKAQSTHNIPYGLPVVKGQMDALSGVHKYGYNDAASTSWETVWDLGGEYTWITTANTLVVTSTGGASDDGVKVTLEGIAATTWAPLIEEVELGSSGTATTTNSFYRVHRAYISNGQNLSVGAQIEVTQTGGTTKYAIINPTFNQTQMAVYTIPWGYNGYLVQLSATIQKNQDMVMQLRTREFTTGVGYGVWRAKSVISTFAGTVDRSFDFPEHMPQGTDIDLQVKCGALAEVSADFEIILEKL